MNKHSIVSIKEIISSVFMSKVISRLNTGAEGGVWMLLQYSISIFLPILKALLCVTGEISEPNQYDFA